MGNPHPQQVDRKVAGMGGLFFVALTLGLGFLGLWLLEDTHQQYTAWLDSDAAVLLEDTGGRSFMAVRCCLSRCSYLASMAYGLE